MASTTEGPIKIFVGGASGKVGATTISHLLTDYKGKVIVRGGLRHGRKLNDELRKEVTQLGRQFDTMTLDYRQMSQITEAVKGYDTAFFVPPRSSDRVQLVKNFIDGCTSVGCKHIVITSISDVEQFQNEVAHQFRVMEECVQKSGMQYTVLRCNIFMDILALLHGPMTTGEYPLPLKSTATFSPFALDDVGHCAAVVLANFNKHGNKVYTLSSPEEITGPRFTEALSRVWKREIKFVEMAPKEWKQYMITKGHMSKERAKAWIEVFTLISEGKVERFTKDYTTITGRKPTDLEAYFQAHKRELFGEVEQAR